MIAIIKYNAGNTGSLYNAVKRLGYDCIITDDTAEIQNADKVLFPGVGEAVSAMEYLRERELDKVIINLKQPVLGICLGLQLMCNTSAEGDTQCMGIFNIPVHKFPPLDIVPHMGWNNCTSLQGSLFKGINSNDDLYFVHSYYAALSDFTVAQCNYILPFSAALQKNNFYAVQFHTEKSGTTGEQILRNFLSL
jgi:glutamine amidotransferase